MVSDSIGNKDTSEPKEPVFPIGIDDPLVYEAFAPAGPGDTTKPPSPFRVAGQVIEDAVCGAANTVIDEVKNHPGRFALEAGGAIALGVAATASSPLLAAGAAAVGAGEAVVAVAAAAGTAIEGIAATTLGVGTIAGGVAATKNIRHGVAKSQKDIEIITQPEKDTPQEIAQANKNIEANLGPGALAAILTAGGAIVAGGNAARLLGKVSIAKGVAADVSAVATPKYEVTPNDVPSNELEGAITEGKLQDTAVFAKGSDHGDGGGKPPEGPGTPWSWKRPKDVPAMVVHDSATGKVTSEIWTMPDGSTQRVEYDPVTGKPKFEDWKYQDGGTAHKEFDPATGNPKFSNLTFPNGTGRVVYDPATGIPKFRDLTYLDGAKEHTEYHSVTGKRFTDDVTYPDGSTGSILRDPATGNPVKAEVTKLDGSLAMHSYDAVTGKLDAELLEYPDGRTIYREFDPATGNVKYIERLNPDGSKWVTEYGPATEKPKPIDWTKVAGIIREHTEYGHAEYDAATGNVKSTDLTKPDGTKVHSEYDATTGNVKSTDVTKPDKTQVHSEYDVATLNLKSTNLTKPDGTKEYAEYDPITGNLRSRDVTGPDGFTRHVEYDPNSHVISLMRGK